MSIVFIEAPAIVFSVHHLPSFPTHLTVLPFSLHQKAVALDHSAFSKLVLDPLTLVDAPLVGVHQHPLAVLLLRASQPLADVEVLVARLVSQLLGNLELGAEIWLAILEGLPL